MDTQREPGSNPVGGSLSRTQQMIRQVRNSKAAKEVRRAAPPWGLIILAALAMGLGVACMVQAFTTG